SGGPKPLCSSVFSVAKSLFFKHTGRRGTQKEKACSLALGKLLNLDHACRCGGFNLLHACDNLAGKVIERLGGRRVLAFKYRRLASVSSLADPRIELPLAKIGHC